MSILTSVMRSVNFKKFKEFLSKLWEFINLILILILIFGFFVNTGPGADDIFAEAGFRLSNHGVKKIIHHVKKKG